MGKKHKASHRKSEAKPARKHARAADAPAPVNRITGLPAALPQPSSAALPPAPRVVRPESDSSPAATPRVPTHPGLVRLCQFLRDRASSTISPAPKKT
ncbi:MAG: hypothetical protein KF708_18460 [Pirellulales bacterium]|nr:hypothetical protein [Pirellulales bacterium]